jgi:hypothetical protein
MLAGFQLANFGSRFRFSSASTAHAFSLLLQLRQPRYAQPVQITDSAQSGRFKPSGQRAPINTQRFRLKLVNEQFSIIENRPITI